ncbi:tetratricopeptide repeat protein [Demequina sp. NBRC 110057]|uniref:tetratricopeptide repeat protein n=1 Tax=Demequina sp. NBRC 110057 TaxID=1570346 RepID=UPI001F18DA53|nr:tetratricopeptide repeat protein [Demequina sp. NBRC 110057]
MATFWDGASRDDAAAALAQARELAACRPGGDPAALFELASAHDYVGEEAEAIGLYEEAIAGGLDARRHDEAVIQLASSLRNVDRSADAVALLEATPVAAALAPAAAGFLALALHDLGRHADAMRVALGAVSPTQYSGALTRYASDLDPRASSMEP